MRVQAWIGLGALLVIAAGTPRAQTLAERLNIRGNDTARAGHLPAAIELYSQAVAADSTYAHAGL